MYDPRVNDRTPISDRTPSDDIFEFLVLTFRHLTTNRDMSMTSGATLSALDRLGPQRVTTLAGIAAVSQPSMTQLLQRLQAKGLVERRPDNSDARAWLFGLTSYGHDLLDKHRSVSRGRLDELLADLPNLEQLRAVIAEALPTLRQHAQSTPGSPNVQNDSTAAS